MASTCKITILPSLFTKPFSSIQCQLGRSGRTTYKKPCALVLGMRDEWPVFGKLDEVYVLNSNSVYFNIQPLETIEYSSHFHCYIVKVSDSLTQIVSHKSLFSFVPHVRILPGSILLYQSIILLVHHFILFT